MTDNFFRRAAGTARRLLAAAAVMVSLAGPLGAQTVPPATFEPKVEEPEEFPDNPGRDESFYGCTACHAFKLVASQGFTRERWNETIDNMTTVHGMPKLEGADREKILDYLAKSFPPRTQPRGFQNPFLNQ
jgi:hypothetical protein